MLAYLLKSGICLAIFYLFYKLLLEKEPIHIFKRIYLLGGLILAFAIPLITFTTTVEVEPSVVAPSTFSTIDFEPPILEAEALPINYWTIILWTIYGFGVVLFGLKFLFNLFQIDSKIRRNTQQKVNRFTYVLLENLATPHTFFNYIFLNKQQYLQHQIPQEVFWHEETHAKQKHSFDVVMIELLQVVFWFNPLLYFIKKDIKLNHEFLADRAVLSKGVPLTVYQEILLAFSSKSNEPVLANALNYSSTKKKFTIMKTKTSKKAVWIKSLILLPLVAVLIYGFSEKVTIEKVSEPLTASKKLKVNKDGIRIYINKNKEVTIDNKPIAFSAISAELIKISKGTAANDPKIFVELEGHLESRFLDELEKELSKSNLSIYEIKATSLTLNEEDKNVFFKSTAFTADSIVVNLKNGEKIVGISKPNKEMQGEATTQEIAEYNKLAKEYNKQPEENRVVKLKDVKRLEFIFNKMTVQQKGNSEPFPNFLPAPSVKNQNKEKKNYSSLQDELKDYKIKNTKYEKLRNQEPHYIERSSTEQKALDLLFSDLGSLYFKLSKENKQKVKRPIHPITPYIKIMKDGEKYYKKRSELTDEDKALLPPPPPPPTLHQETIDMGSKALQELFKKFSEEAKSYGLAVKNQIGTQKNNNEINTLYKNILELHQEYVKLATEEGILPPPPPPPPTPPNPTDHIIEMAKKGAIFYYDDNKITSDKAIELTKKNKSINIQVLGDGSSKPVVKLSTTPYKN